MDSEKVACLASPIANQPYCPPTEEEQHGFLQRHFLFLTARVQTVKFYPYLLTEQVLDREDNEIIEREHSTSVDRAGALIQMIQTRGTRAFVAFMTVLEYKYRDQYEKITGVKPRRPPSEWYTHPRHSSVKQEMDTLIASLHQIMIKELNAKVEDSLVRLKSIEAILTDKEHDLNDEMMALEDDRNEALSKVERSQKENAELVEQGNGYKKQASQLETQLLETNQELNSVKRKLQLATGDVHLEREKSKKFQMLHKKGFPLSRASVDHIPEPRLQTQLIREREEHMAEVDALNGEVTLLEEKITLQADAMDKLNAELQHTTQQLRNEKGQFEVLEDDYKQLQRKKDEAIRRQNYVVKSLQEKCDELERLKQDVIRKNRELQRDLDQMRGASALRRSESAELRRGKIFEPP